ncbi:ABC-2 type transport system permease protein [Hathewaya proteolytica DSM 3090]|uniref:ABC-2 type transport system permease protein n=1 Tax=Hathewaya proteolytica DSM 3090 TaxID=1121331 RepID=A0A1M6NXN7_9CLOT|nr:ABC transporter permease subunit [Hathewaya proteolytica]SHK00497.1 ABC-2 type transport system permease protein [Hathewaya proteolytica DSM 3090]
MISMPLFKRNMISAVKLMVIFIAILTMYTVVIIWMFKPELANVLVQYKEMMPEFMAAVGMNGNSGTLIEFINTYLYGFLMLIVPMIFEIMIVNKTIMKYVDSGSMACLLSTPNSRKKIIVTQIVSIFISVTMLIAVITLIGVISSELMFPGKLEIGKYFNLNLSVLILHFVISSIALISACFFNDTRGFFVVGAGVPLLFYLIQMLSNMGGKLENLKYFTLYTLFPGKYIISNSNGVLCSNVIMITIAISLCIASISVFTKKDLPL